MRREWRSQWGQCVIKMCGEIHFKYTKEKVEKNYLQKWINYTAKAHRSTDISSNNKCQSWNKAIWISRMQTATMTWLTLLRYISKSALYMCYVWKVPHFVNEMFTITYIGVGWYGFRCWWEFVKLSRVISMGWRPLNLQYSLKVWIYRTHFIYSSIESDWCVISMELNGIAKRPP